MKIKSILAFIVSVFLVNALFGTVTTTLINYSQFTEVFDYANSKPKTAENLTPVWYVQYQAGDGTAISNSDPESHELETGDLSGSAGLPFGEAEFDWTPNSINSYSYSVIIDGSGNIDSTFESSTVADNQTSSFNKIYFGLYVNNNADTEYVQVDHNYESETISSLLGDRTLPDNFVGFVLEDDTKLINIAEFNLQGQITLFMKDNATYEEWSYTIVGVNSVPEPSAYALIFGVISLVWIMVRRR